MCVLGCLRLCVCVGVAIVNKGQQDSKTCLFVHQGCVCVYVCVTLMPAGVLQLYSFPSEAV